MKFDREAWIQKKRKVPRGTYLLMIFMGIYMFYIISRVIGGLSEPHVWARALIYVGIALLGAASFTFIMIGMSSLVKRDFREAYPEDDEEDTTADIQDGVGNEALGQDGGEAGVQPQDEENATARTRDGGENK